MTWIHCVNCQCLFASKYYESSSKDLWVLRYYPKTPMLRGNKCTLESHSHTMYQGRKLSLLPEKYGGLLCPCWPQENKSTDTKYHQHPSWVAQPDLASYIPTPQAQHLHILLKCEASSLWRWDPSVTSLPFFLQRAIKLSITSIQFLFVQLFTSLKRLIYEISVTG